MFGLMVNWFHVVLVAPLFLYVGAWYATQPAWVYWVLLGLGVYVVMYHGQKVLVSLPSPWWVSVFHMLVVGPVLLLLGGMGTNAPEFLYPVMSLLGFATLGYHGQSLVVTN